MINLGIFKLMSSLDLFCGRIISNDILKRKFRVKKADLSFL